VGAAGFGMLAGQTGYPVGFAVTAVVIVVAFAGTRTDRPERSLAPCALRSRSGGRLTGKVATSGHRPRASSVSLAYGWRRREVALVGGEGMRHCRVRSGSAGLAVTEVGSGEAVVLLHAGVADRRSWYPVMDALADRFRLLAYDQRGFGETDYQPERCSPVDDLRAVLDAAGVDRAVLVGASRGGQVAAEAAFRWPERMRGLALVGSAPVGGPSPDTLAHEIDKLFDAVEAAETTGDTAEVNRLEAHLWLDGPLMPEHRVGGPARELFLDMNGRALAAPPRGEEEELPRRWDQLADFPIPTLVVIGEHDLPLLVDRARAMAATIPSVRLVILAGSAHLPMLDSPAELVDALSAFLTGLA